MIRLIGACLTIGGMAGAGMCICMERDLRVRQLKGLGQVFEMVAGEISYSCISLPEVLTEIGRKLSEVGTEEVGAVLYRAGVRLCDGSGQDVETVWTEEMEPFLGQTKLEKQEKELVLSFPAAVWFLDGPRQQTAVLSFAHKLQEAALLAQEKERETNRLTMAASLAGGVFAAIMLL